MTWLDIVELGFIVWLVFVLFRYILYFYRKLQSRSWPTVPGTVQKGEVSRGNSRLYGLYRSTLGYGYKVDGVRYAGMFVVMAKNDSAAEDLQRQLDGKSAPVCYDPEHPERSFLAEDKLMSSRVYQNPFWFE
jgi:hypothetical protein